MLPKVPIVGIWERDSMEKLMSKNTGVNPLGPLMPLVAEVLEFPNKFKTSILQ